jgi:hypothetical protein
LATWSAPSGASPKVWITSARSRPDEGQLHRRQLDADQPAEDPAARRGEREAGLLPLDADVACLRERALDFHQRVEDLKRGAAPLPDETNAKPLPKAIVTIAGDRAQTYEVNLGAKVFTDRPFEITSIAPELRGLTGIRISHEVAKQGKYEPLNSRSTSRYSCWSAM